MASWQCLVALLSCPGGVLEAPYSVFARQNLVNRALGHLLVCFWGGRPRRRPGGSLRRLCIKETKYIASWQHLGLPWPRLGGVLEAPRGIFWIVSGVPYARGDHSQPYILAGSALFESKFEEAGSTAKFTKEFLNTFPKISPTSSRIEV